MSTLPIGIQVAGATAPELIAGIAAAERAGLQTAWLTVGGPARRSALNQSLPCYARMLQDAGYPGAASGEPSESTVRALVVRGSDREIAERIGELQRFGIDEVLASPVALLDDLAPVQARTLALLGELARG